jgi:hypothetical protein
VETKYDSMRGGWYSKEVVGSLGVAMWKHIRRGGKSFLDLLNMKWAMDQRSSFDMICGVGTNP